MLAVVALLSGVALLAGILLGLAGIRLLLGYVVPRILVVISLLLAGVILAVVTRLPGWAVLLVLVVILILLILVVVSLLPGQVLAAGILGGRTLRLLPLRGRHADNRGRTLAAGLS